MHPLTARGQYRQETMSHRPDTPQGFISGEGCLCATRANAQVTVRKLAREAFRDAFTTHFYNFRA